MNQRNRSAGHLLIFLAAAAAAGAVAAPPDDDEDRNDNELAYRVAHDFHGAALDERFEAVTLDHETVHAMQDAMLREIVEQAPEELKAQFEERLAEALHEREWDEAEASLMRNAQPTTTTYTWRCLFLACRPSSSAVCMTVRKFRDC